MRFDIGRHDSSPTWAPRKQPTLRPREGPLTAGPAAAEARAAKSTARARTKSTRSEATTNVAENAQERYRKPWRTLRRCGRRGRGAAPFASSTRPGPRSSKALRMATIASARPGRGRDCHQVLLPIGARSLTAMVVRIFERVHWRWALNGRPARG
jgi:hypothetical protein